MFSKFFLFVILIIYLLKKINALNENPEIKIKINRDSRLFYKIRGTTMPDYQRGDLFYAFLGIPFAKPPIGPLRFSNPVAADIKPNTIIDATTEKDMCLQRNDLFPNAVVTGSEDCLYLNVYKPNTKCNKLPVMVYIHGGGYFSGTASPSVHGPEYFMDTKKVILVVFGYRLGVLGFLSTGDATGSPGNFALKDQTMALKWVKQNIQAFGGDKNQITIFGQSAGAASVHMHMISPLSKGLFKNSILLSGNAIAPYNSVTRNPIELARKQAKAVGIDSPETLDSVELVNSLRKIDGNTLVDSIYKLKFWSVDPLTLYRPVIEPAGNMAFLTEDPVDIWKRGDFKHVRWLNSIVEHEGFVRAGAIVTNDNLLTELNQNFDDLLWQLMEFEENVEHKIKQIKDYYFHGNNFVNGSNLQEFVNLYSDRAFLHPLYQSIQQYLAYADVEKNPVSLIKFVFKGPKSYSYFFTFSANDYGVVHCDDLIYLFRSPALFPQDFPKNSTEAKMIEQLVKTYIYFAKNGKLLEAEKLSQCNKASIDNGNFCDYQIFDRNIDGMIDIKYSNRFDTNMTTFWNNLLEK